MNKKDTVIIVDDLEEDHPMEPGQREKVLDLYDAMMATVPPGAITVFSCGPSTSPCGPEYDDHAWDDEEDLYDGAGRVCGGTKKCSKCGMAAMDYDLWNAE